MKATTALAFLAVCSSAVYAQETDVGTNIAPECKRTCRGSSKCVSSLTKKAEYCVQTCPVGSPCQGTCLKGTKWAYGYCPVKVFVNSHRRGAA
ncbi:predicted protein [Plenodomus lingam JN3]|uniref:Predicted protein n=1 Tax=Leptosphaeria maculans (strain JN3 / isolate v23.1.3 / race Av1-4-5-6-7-8) TaxID=985895 RepID=E5A8K6_LEPMJ|nr:predicted protein [Plenodomus lingam JN3]CBX99951.1 predicted protein [Plenodomus lingam JN3]